MGQPAEKRRRASYADLEAVEQGKIAELIDGELYVFPRPAPKHLNVESSLLADIHGPFQRGRGGPGGWWILAEPEIHFPDPATPRGVQVVSPDIAGWRADRMPDLPETAYFTVTPDWICEVLSPSTERHDRKKKMPLHAANEVPCVWLIDPFTRTLEIYTLGAGKQWKDPVIYRDSARMRAVPFDAIELELDSFWARPHTASTARG